MKPAYRRTMTACFLGYIVQAIVNNFAPLLFVMFQQDYGIPLSKITLLIARRISYSLYAVSGGDIAGRTAEHFRISDFDVPAYGYGCI